MSIVNRSLSERDERHRHFGGEVRKSDYYSAEYYNPALHLQHFLEDWDYDLELQSKSEEREEN